MRTRYLPLLFVSVFGLSGCFNDDDDTATSKIRVTHASSDAPLVAVELNGDTVEGLEMVDYQQGSSLLRVDAGTYDVGVVAQLAGDETTNVIEANLDFAPDMQYDIVALGQTADISAVVLSREDMSPQGNEVRIDVLHAHPDVPPVDIYIGLDSTIDNIQPAVPGLAFAEDSDLLPVTLAAGTYRLRITLAGSKDVVYDSGELPLAGGSDLMISAVPNVNGGAVSPVNLLVADGEAVAVVRNTGEQATVRVVHAVNEAPNVDVVAGGAAVGGYENIAFKEYRSGDVAPGSYDLAVTPAGDPGTELISAPGTEIAAATQTSIYAVGTVSTIEPLIIEEDLRSVATYAKVRVVHASTLAGTVDIHASADGTFSEETIVVFGAIFKDTAVLNVPGGSYTLAVTAAGDLNPLIEQAVTIKDGGVYSVTAVDDLSLAVNVDTEPAQ
ncbi:hypothetical protein ABT56_14185 [Photobacterium aquae]|uniref:DUF4397 domain-containing protein n=1 Tax=Photobacterium aquae TaxID=1195763 RepID=A0A0J1GY66_9GAMM|nr:DUF4397 domain-containing protein [Photobacterium aquae]KLV04610.1 hypothetical protein ABT56_14185 [Photobacterium aquae]